MSTKQHDSLLSAAYAFLLRVQHNHDAELCFVSVTVCQVCQDVGGHTDQCFVPVMTDWAIKEGNKTKG